MLAAALCCATLVAVTAFAADPVLGNFEEMSADDRMERLATAPAEVPNKAFEEYQHALIEELQQQEQGWPKGFEYNTGPDNDGLLVIHRAEMTAEQPIPFELQSAEFEVDDDVASAELSEQPQTADHEQPASDFDWLDWLVESAKEGLGQEGANTAEPGGTAAAADSEAQSVARRKLAQDGGFSSQCGVFSNEVNNYVNQGWSVKFSRFANPEKCPNDCKTDYRGPTDGVYSLQCNTSKCFCAFIDGDKQYRNVVMKDTGALSIVDAMPADCPKEDCIGGGYEFCEPGTDCSA